MRLFQEDADESLNEIPQEARYEHRAGKVKLESIQRKERKISERLLTIVQVSVCGVLLLAALVVKLLGGECIPGGKGLVLSEFKSEYCGAGAARRCSPGRLGTVSAQLLS